jgi:aryl carrier-like protein
MVMNETELLHRLREEVAAILSLPAAEIDLRVPLREYGLDSAMATALAGRLERGIGRKIDVLVLFEHPTIARLAAHLANSEGRS